MRFFNGMKLFFLLYIGKVFFYLKLGNDGFYVLVKFWKEVLIKEYFFNCWLIVKRLLGFW